ncbi:DUF2194 domain-containing protein [Paenibacillus yanchengensis]|uniref:DUF2194 domain-containing protein n=1 Tax=Paenibacillus yanchengensis TaxID=2035833 RepID=A0ABW4YQQ1_9BACL
MKNDVKFSRSIIIILIAVLLLAIVTQIARSQFVLKFMDNSTVYEQSENVKLLKHEMKNNLSVNMTVSDKTADNTYCLVYDGVDELSVAIKDNTMQVLEYMKQPYRVVNMDKETFVFEECSAVLLTVSLEELEYDIDNMDEYVSEGGSLFVMRSSHPSDVMAQMYRKLGFVHFTHMIGEFGIELTSNVLIGLNGSSFTDNFIYNDIVAGELDDSIQLLAQTSGELPLMWKKEYGLGSFVIFNGSALDQKDFRGIISGGISLLTPDYMYPIFNTKIFYIDDFPAPFRMGRDEEIYKLYGKDIPSFFRDIWWPQMLSAANKYDLKYTAVTIQTYQDNVKSPFPRLDDEEKHNLISFGREVIKNEGEVGIHGYNHQSMQTNASIAKHFDYKAWPGADDMKASITAILEYLGEALPNYKPMSYVPPSNVLGPEGRKALTEAWPEMSVIASLYGIDPDNRAYVQEFEVAEDGVVEMPRITSGYFDTPYNVWFEANTVNSIGVFSHFLHPDDLLDKDRNRDRVWTDLYKDFEQLLNRVETNYPWLRSITSAEAAIDVAHLLQSELEIQYEGNRISAKSTTLAKEQYFILRTDKKIAEMNNCDVQQIDQNTYLVTAYEQNFSFELSR